MEMIVNYKLSDFLQIEDVCLVQDYLMILDLLKPLKEIDNPKYRIWNKQPGKLHIKEIKNLSFGEVTLIRNNFNESTISSILESIQIVSGLNDKEILGLTITTFYGIISNIKQQVISITNMEINELSDDSFDINVEAVNARERMERFGVLNVIDSLAKEDILRWNAIEKLQYMTVFTKLLMDKEKNKIQQEIAELQRKKQLKK